MRIETTLKLKLEHVPTTKIKKILQSQKDIYNQQRLGGLENVTDEYSALKYKVGTSELQLTQLYETLTPDKLALGLNKLGMYIYDYDLTTDLKGCIDKSQMYNLFNTRT